MLPEPGELDGNALELNQQQIIEDDDGEGEPFIGFADDDEDTAEETPLVKRLRDQLRDTTRQLARGARTQAVDDPEPQVPARPNLERDFNFDQDRFDEALDAYEAAKEAKIKWDAREEGRKADRERTATEQTRAVEQQKKSLGVSDFDERAAHVRERLHPNQIDAILKSVPNAAALIYALGRSPTKLDILAAEDDAVKFGMLLGQYQKDLKMGKRQPPPPEQQVRGGTATLTGSTDKVLERLEREAERTGDRTKIVAYKRERRAAA